MKRFSNLTALILLSCIVLNGAILVSSKIAKSSAGTPEHVSRPGSDVVSAWVSAALRADPRVESEGIEVSAKAGIATLRGTVPTLAGKRYALFSAQGIRGVLGVVDQLEVVTPTRPDFEIVRDVNRRLVRSRRIQNNQIRVSASDGTVTLSGSVASRSRQGEAELLAAQVHGVRAVVNKIEVEPRVSRTDAGIQVDIESALERDIYLSGLPIEVSVKKGVVTLTGRASAAFEKSRASNEAGSVSNVRSVINEIKVDWPADHARHKALPTPHSDDELKKIVEMELAEDDRIDALGIMVAVSQGHVVLSGDVPSDRQLRLAEEDARNVLGVAWVTNETRVVFTERPNSIVRKEIEGIFATDSVLSRFMIGVSVKSGVVTLRGDVDNGYQRSHAAALASHTRGVQEVENRLRTAVMVTAADEAVAAELERRLARDARTGYVSDRINVEVDHGVVTLSGDVDLISERRAAEQIARRTPGVRRVRNRLAVDPYPYPWEAPPEGEVPDWDPDFFDYPSWALNLSSLDRTAPWEASTVSYRDARG